MHDRARVECGVSSVGGSRREGKVASATIASGAASVYIRGSIPTMGEAVSLSRNG